MSNEDELLKQYTVRQTDEDLYRPVDNFFVLGKKYSEEFKNGILNGEDETFNKKKKDILNGFYGEYIKSFTKTVLHFAKAVNEKKISVSGFPLSDWKHLSNDEEYRFVMPDFNQLMAASIENVGVQGNQAFIYSTQTLSDKEFSKVVANFSKAKNAVEFICDLERIYPSILKSDEFNPLEDMINEGNPDLLKEFIDKNMIEDLIKKGYLKPIKDIQIDSNLIVRLASAYDDVKKKNIAKAINVAANEKLLNVSSANMKELYSVNYDDFKKIPVDKKINAAEVWTYSINNVPLFHNNNHKIIQIIEKQDEHLKQKSHGKKFK